MATVAEKKAAVGYRGCPTCDNCEHEIWWNDFSKEYNSIRRRCEKHGWAVKARAWCPEHSFVTQDDL